MQRADQAPLPGAAPGAALKMSVQSIGFSKRANPKQSADATVVDQQMQCFLELHRQLGKPLQRENVGAGLIGVATMAETIQLFEL
ncbi:MAG: Uncharacterised protein [Synechococcus sp. MIT S9220]|nr:MAG: Uncharacterised protein [Synechococcus sp. MIT S9220]